MQNDGKIDELNETINERIGFLMRCDATTVSVDVGIITMGGVTPEVVMPLETVHNYDMSQVYEANGNALVSEALQMAVNEVKARKIFYRQNLIDYYRPRIIMLSDGYLTDNEGRRISDKQTIQKYAEFVKDHRHIARFYTFYIGRNSEAKEIMKSLASTRDGGAFTLENNEKGDTYAYILKDEKRELFEIFRYMSYS